MRTTMLTEAQVLDRLRGLRDPELGRPLGELAMLRSAAVGPNNAITVTIDLPTPAYPGRERIVAAVR